SWAGAPRTRLSWCSRTAGCRSRTGWARRTAGSDKAVGIFQWAGAWMSVGAALDRHWRGGLSPTKSRAGRRVCGEPDAVWEDADVDAGDPARDRRHGADDRAGAPADLLRAV